MDPPRPSWCSYKQIQRSGHLAAASAACAGAVASNVPATTLPTTSTRRSKEFRVDIVSPLVVNSALSRYFGSGTPMSTARLLTTGQTYTRRALASDSESARSTGARRL
ncbi:hypothetical protein GCM10022247_66820 [Allokutzneria multivorans]|uniref:Secreted protein n=1 Tax=Allokutzneria multivorans TaxID=1142134 RepID=A0ABP7TWR0_9PSEU